MFMPSCHDRLTSVDAAGDNVHPTIPRYCFPSFPIPFKLEYHTEKRLREKWSEYNLKYKETPRDCIFFKKRRSFYSGTREMPACLLNRWQLRLTAMPFHYLRPYWLDFQSSRYCNMPSKSGNGPASLDHASNSYSKQNGLSKNTREPLVSIGTAAAHATFPSWMSVVLMVSLIFGGCCANVCCREIEDMRKVSNC